MPRARSDLVDHPCRKGRGTVAVLVAATMLGIGSFTADAGERATPYVFGEVSIEMQNDWTPRSGNSEFEFDDLFTTEEAYLGLQLTRELSLRTTLVLEPVTDPGPGRDRVFEDQGLFAETLFVQYATDSVSVFAGKFTPQFGVAWDIAPGIDGDDFAGDYELAERDGFGGTVTWHAAAAGTYTLAASAFFLDTSPLSGSAITDRGTTSRADGGASNTGDPRSFAIALHGAEIASLPDLEYDVAVVHQAKGRGDDHDEFGYAMALHGSFDVGHDIAIEPVLEYVALDNADGGPDDIDYLTGGAELLRGPWTVSLTGSWRRTASPDGGAISDAFVHISGGYEFESGIAVDVGYKSAEEDGVDSDTFGVLLSYELGF